MSKSQSAFAGQWFGSAEIEVDNAIVLKSQSAFAGQWFGS